MGQICKFLRWTRGYKIPSSAAFGQIGRDYVARVESFAEENLIPMIRFEKGQNKEEAARPYVEEAAKAGKESVVLIGVAQEKTMV